MDKFENAKHLVSHAQNQLSNIEINYRKSLAEKTVRTDLCIEIKNLLENLRSALDYSARNLYNKYCETKEYQDIYFPYVRLNQTKDDFLNKRVNKCIPGIVEKTDIVEKLLSYQHFVSEENDWLPQFMSLCNKNKHEDLTPQERKEYKETKVISNKGGSVTIGGGAGRIVLDKGAKMIITSNGKTEDIVIPGGQIIEAGKPFEMQGDGRQEIITWVSFVFSSIDQPVMPFLKNCIKKTDKIVNELAQM